jgi:hypothetical protein
MAIRSPDLTASRGFELLADQHLDARPREVRQAGGEKRVKALAGFIHTKFHGVSLTAKKDPARFKFAHRPAVSLVSAHVRSIGIHRLLP